MSLTTAGIGISTVGPGDFEPVYMPLDRRSRPEAGVVHIWFLELEKLARSLRGALDAHAAPTDKTPFTAGQLRFARRFYLRLLIGAYLGMPGKEVKINRSGRGKPTLDTVAHQQALHFSMAKSARCLLIGFATSGPIGVDLEPARRRAHDALGVARRYFSAAESAAMAAMDADLLNEAFLRTWACKEAVVKASGEGIAGQLHRFTVETDPALPPSVVAMEDDDAARWSLQLLRPAPAFLGAVAACSPVAEIRAFRLLPVPRPAAE